MKRNVSVELSNRELWLLRSCLEGVIKETEESDPYKMGVLDPDRVGELQEQRKLLEKVVEALIESGG